MNLLQKFKEYNKQELKLETNQTKLVLAVSGGIDSVVLVDLCHKTGFDFVIAHCNFRLRGDESTRDEDFVRSLGDKYGKEVLIKHFDTKTYAEENKCSIQVAARELRYGWFEEVVESRKSKVESKTAELSTHNSRLSPFNFQFSTFLATAHHADDNIETLLLNFFRGTGISGMHGILPKQGNVIRPLLFAKRDEIIAYAKEQNIDWVEDSSNASDKYSRNFVRHQVVPLMKTIYPQVEANLLGNIERFKEIELIYNASIAQTKLKLVEVKGNEQHIPILKLKKQTPLKTIVFELIKDFGFAATQTDEVIKLLDADNGSFMASASHRLIINRNWLIIAPLQTEEATNIIIEEGTRKIVYTGGELSFEISETDGENLPTEATIATINADEIKYPLLLRPCKQGDYFYPLGMLKKKKLSKFFIDQKLSKTEKERVWVLESDKRIAWVVGYRIDNRFRIKESSEMKLVINYKVTIQPH